VDAARTLIPMFVFMLTPILIPVVVELVGRLSDGIGRRSRRKRRPAARRVRQVEADTPQVIAS
jgi:hypothetical protein